MKTLIQYLRDDLRQENRPWLFAAVAAFLALALWLNYGFGLEKNWVDGKSFTLASWLRYCLFYGAAYWGTTALVCAFRRDWRLFADGRFWLFSGISATGFALYDDAPWHYEIIRELAPWELRKIGSKFASNVLRPLYCALPVLLIWLALHRKSRPGFYGFSAKQFTWKPYLWAILFMIPLIAAASFTDGFQAKYPRYWPQARELDYLSAETWQLLLFFNLCYGLNFVFIEWFFRGWLSQGMELPRARDALLPMVVMYCFIHFQKPLGEAVGSVFGGYILGVAAQRTRSIYGGLAAHLGVAWGMELAAGLQKVYDGG